MLQAEEPAALPWLQSRWPQAAKGNSIQSSPLRAVDDKPAVPSKPLPDPEPRLKTPEHAYNMAALGLPLGRLSLLPLWLPLSCSLAATQDGASFLENVLLYYGENSSISTGTLDDLLLLLSSRRSEEVSAEENPLAQQEVGTFPLQMAPL